jgi:hypothetical protein
VIEESADKAAADEVVLRPTAANEWLKSLPGLTSASASSIAFGCPSIRALVALDEAELQQLLGDEEEGKRIHTLLGEPFIGSGNDSAEKAATIDWESMKVKELREMSARISGFSKAKKAELIDKLR